MSAQPSSPPSLSSPLSNRARQCLAVLDQAEAHVRSVIASLEGTSEPEPRERRSTLLRRRTTEAEV